MLDTQMQNTFQTAEPVHRQYNYSVVKSLMVTLLDIWELLLTTIITNDNDRIKTFDFCD